MVANPERGEVDLEAHTPSGTKHYTLKLSINAAVALQAKRKKTMGEIVAELSTMDFNTIRALAFVVLQKHHKDEITTEELAGDVVDDAGGVVPFMAAMKALLEMGQEAADAGNPPTAQGETTGGASTSALGVSA